MYRPLIIFHSLPIIIIVMGKKEILNTLSSLYIYICIDILIIFFLQFLSFNFFLPIILIVLARNKLL